MFFYKYAAPTALLHAGPGLRRLPQIRLGVPRSCGPAEAGTPNARHHHRSPPDHRAEMIFLDLNLFILSKYARDIFVEVRRAGG